MFVIGDQVLTGLQDRETLEVVIEAELKAQGNAAQPGQFEPRSLSSTGGTADQCQHGTPDRFGQRVPSFNDKGRVRVDLGFTGQGLGQGFSWSLVSARLRRTHR
jgi:hypothetical protein